MKDEKSAAIVSKGRLFFHFNSCINSINVALKELKEINFSLFCYNKERIHIPIDDPSKVTGNEDEILSAFRKTRDEIKLKVRDLLSQFLPN